MSNPVDPEVTELLGVAEDQGENKPEFDSLFKAKNRLLKVESMRPGRNSTVSKSQRKKLNLSSM